MVSAQNLPSATTLITAYTTVAASALLAKTVINEVQSMASQIIPQEIQHNLLSKLKSLTRTLQSHMTLVIDEFAHDGITKNDIFTAAELFLRSKLATSLSIARAKILKGPDENEPSLSVFNGEKIEDSFQGIHVVWELSSVQVEKKNLNYEGIFSSEKSEKRSLELKFHKKFNDQILSKYIPHLLEKAKFMKQEKKTVMLHDLGNFLRAVKLNHPSTFETMAMDPTTKKDLMDDLDRFLNRREFYRRVGKAWKRGYLLYGPPGSGKSSLIAAMANYLKFDVYDLELTSLRSNSDFKNLIIKTENRSILVIEDIDCSTEFHTRQEFNTRQQSFCAIQDVNTTQAVKGLSFMDKQVTLSGLLNFIDGLWSSCGDERIIVFTTNHKDKLDPALLKPGRMDKHIHMSYCSFSSFRILCSNYLGITHHPTFAQIEELIMEVEAAPAEIAEELMRSEDADIVLEGVIALLEKKKNKKKTDIDEGKEKDSNCKNGKRKQADDDDDDEPKIVKKTREEVKTVEEQT
ncbi:AAA-ATPase At3g50940-like [Impatiens glandulifera]|uniref:AAA-ATPase At3g50940-like n=1 Tax=Impatiens glandulifera TaxID=253017 RepID=UPI001FB11058|nr:AAA-ATPase At3g50940-like [Impatiens glandulifera]